MAPAARAISAVRSVELLSHTINSTSQLRRVKASDASWISASDAPSSRSSLKAGMTMEIFTPRNVLHLPSGFNAGMLATAPAAFSACFFRQMIFTVGMTIWILALLLLAAAIALGHKLGAINAAFTFVGILLGTLLSGLAGKIFKPLLPHL